MTLPDRSSCSRREFCRIAVAVGGSTALAACLSESAEEPVPPGPDGTGSSADSLRQAEEPVPTGTDDPDALPQRQHAWNDALETDADGNVRSPDHQVLVALSVREEPTEASRELVETALRGLERAYEWSSDGLVFTLGYTPAYFDRHFDAAPAGVDLPQPAALTAREDPEGDSFDALLHLASDRADVVLEAEEALFGEVETANGESLEADLSTVFDRIEDRRRTGFVGPGLPAEHTDTPGVPDAVPEAAPFFMGFRSGFREGQATEDRVTIEEGPFAGGTTQHVSSMTLQLDVWYEQDSHEQRVAKLFSPEHAAEDRVGEVGEKLTTSNGLTTERIEAAETDARERGVVGHAQKAARAREDGQPIMLRRDFNTVDGEAPGVHFLALQREIEDFVRVREAMTGADLAGGGVGSVLNNGILQYLFVRRRGNYLLPPRPLRALPTPDP